MIVVFDTLILFGDLNAFLLSILVTVIYIPIAQIIDFFYLFSNKISLNQDAFIVVAMFLNGHCKFSETQAEMFIILTIKTHFRVIK